MGLREGDETVGGNEGPAGVDEADGGSSGPVTFWRLRLSWFAPEVVEGSFFCASSWPGDVEGALDLLPTC
jgi:hypothetical protein